MKRLLRLFLILALAVTVLPLSRATAQTPSTPINCDTVGALLPGVSIYKGALSLGVGLPDAEYCIFVPPGWTPNASDLIVFAHGYVFFNPAAPTPTIPWDQLLIQDPQGNIVNLPQIITGLGYAFATTSYSKTGLAVQEGVADILNLVANFPGIVGGAPRRVFLTGASEGGLVTTLALERNPDVFSGGLATCGPIGDFRGQVNYWEDFRVVFDYFFPKTLLTPSLPISPSTAIFIPQDLAFAWAGQNPQAPLHQAVLAALAANPLKVSQLFSVTKAAYDPLDAKGSIPKTVTGILDYNIFATDEGRMELAGMPLDENTLRTTNIGNPYSNTSKRYTGSFNDRALNRGVKRYQADPAVAPVLQLYQTSGKLEKPLVIMHTIGDPIVPYWHATGYIKKAYTQGNLSEVSLIPVLRYGHCAFTQGEAVYAFYTMVLKATAQEMSANQLAPVLPDQKARDDFKKMHEKMQKDPIKELDLSKDTP